MEYLKWHYLKIWPLLLKVWGNLIIFPIYLCSIPLHLRTLFSPWKRQSTKMKPGFHLDDFLGVISFKLIAIGIGFLLRIVVISYGLIGTLVMSILGGLPFILWFFLPLFSLPLYLKRERPTTVIAQKLLKNSNGILKNLILLLINHKQGQYIFWRLGINPLILINLISADPDPGVFSEFEDELKKSYPAPTLTDLLVLASTKYLPLKVILSKHNLNATDVLETCLWYERLHKIWQAPLLLDSIRIRNMSGIGKDWAYGYTVEFDKYSRDLTKVAATYPFLIGRDKEIGKMEKVLLKTEGNNLLLIGEPGVGRHILVETLAYRMMAGNCQRDLAHKRILTLDMHSLVSSKPSLAQVKGVASEIIEEAQRAGNIIVEIDNLDKFVVAQDQRVDLTDVLVKFGRSNIGFIGITTPYDYHKYIENNSQLNSIFEKIILEPPSFETLLEELETSIAPILEKKHNIFITYPALKKVIEVADRYISETPFPGKAIELLDEASVFAKTDKRVNFLLASYVDEYLSEKLQIPMGAVQKGESDKLVHLETLLHAKIINQEEAVRAISSALRRSRLGISSSNRPIGAFLFLGPTGVGKTETAKVLAEIYFGNNDSLLRFDMSQYLKEEGLERLIGSVKLGSAGEMTTALRDHPFSLLLLDEVEKADKEIFNLFLTLIDEGYLTDHMGKKINAKNTIIIATSNAGGEFIRQRINKNVALFDLKKEVVNHVQEEKIFSPEFLNRFDEVVVFTPLSEGHLKDVARLMLKSLNKRLIAKEISIDISDDLVKKLANIGFDPQFGARSMRRAIAEKVEDQIAQKILAKQVKKGDVINIDL